MLYFVVPEISVGFSNGEVWNNVFYGLILDYSHDDFSIFAFSAIGANWRVFLA